MQVYGKRGITIRAQWLSDQFTSWESKPVDKKEKIVRKNEIQLACEYKPNQAQVGSSKTAGGDLLAAAKK